MKFVKLGSIVSIIRGKKPKFSDTPNENSIRVLQIDDLRNDNNIKYTNEKSGVYAYERDILLVWDGANVGTIGYGKKGYIGSTIALLRIKAPNEFATNYIGAFLHSQTELLRRRSIGAAIPHIDRKFLENIQIPVFSLPDQIRIATILDTSHTLIEQRIKSISLLNEFLKSTFLQMFYSNSESEEWKEIKFEELADKKKGSMRTGPFGSDLLHDEFTEKGDVKVLGIDNVVTNTFDWGKNRFITFEKFEKLKRYQVFPEDVLISIMATVGRTAVVPDDISICINSKHLAAITLNKKIANPYFIAYAFHSHPVIINQMTNKTKGAIMEGLNLTIIRKIKLKLPPIELQIEFSKILKDIEIKKILYKSSLHELENLYGSLSQRAFKGEFDLSKLDVLYEEEYSSRDNDRTEPEDFDKPINFENISVQIKKQKYYGGGDSLVSIPEIAGTKISQSSESRINDETDSLWRLSKLLGKTEGIKFNDIEGQAVLKDIFSKRSHGFNFQEIIQFLKKEQFLFSYHQVKDFIFNQLEEKKLYQFYASKEWMQSEFKKVNQDQDDFSGEGNIWFLVNNSSIIK